MPVSTTAAPRNRSQAKKRTLKLALASLALLVASCQSNPLGMSDEEWARLTPEQQMQARMKQADVNQANADRRAAERRRRALLVAEERRRVERIYTSARYGDILECVVEGGIADFRPGWRGYDPAPFTLVRGETKFVPLRESGKGRRKFWTRLSADGLEVSVCARSGKRSRSRYCATISARSDDFSYGVSRPITINDVFQNATLVCAFRPGPGMPQHVIHQHNVKIRRVIHVHHHGRRTARPPHARHERHHRDRPAVSGKAGERVIVVPVVRDRAHAPSPRASTRPDRQERRRLPAEPRYQRHDRAAPAPESADGYEYTPTNAPNHTRSHRVPDASERAREVAAPDSSVHVDREAGRADEPTDCQDAHPSRGRRLAKGRGHGKGRGNRPNCRP